MRISRRRWTIKFTIIIAMNFNISDNRGVKHMRNCVSRSKSSAKEKERKKKYSRSVSRGSATERALRRCLTGILRTRYLAATIWRTLCVPLLSAHGIVSPADVLIHAKRHDLRSDALRRACGAQKLSRSTIEGDVSLSAALNWYTCIAQWEDIVSRKTE